MKGTKTLTMSVLVRVAGKHIYNINLSNHF